ncbi:PREDICTED: casein kinase I [Drosophila arizonae]|uniref:non-specific serine/threonine protein kinase n=1 Tax=Drosophila arizonae TaxID=7263 RepID=A0ABM1PS28_DROAR|nr:PREDICTED: casein kinase I [Drosophila arizonae]
MESLRRTEVREYFVGDYKLLDQFDKGCFGDVYLGKSLYTGERVAIKLEKKRTAHPQLAYEYRVYKTMRPALGLPRVHYYGEEDDYNALVMDLLGPSLYYLFEFCGHAFTMKTVLMLADELLLRLEQVHGRGFVHRDIKPENLCIGHDLTCKFVHLIDFGLSKKYWDPISNVHIPYREDCSLTGTARFASINAHEGIEQSRRDDLVSVGYLLIYFLSGSLPWQNLPAPTKEKKYEAIYEMKRSLSSEQLCSDYPNEFAMYLNYCYKLGFTTKPDYAMLRKRFRGLFNKLYYKRDLIYDWEKLSLEFHRDQKNPGVGSRYAPGKYLPDDGRSGYPIIRNDKARSWS